MNSNDKICENFISVLNNKNIQDYGEEGIWNLIQAVFSGDVFSGITAGKNIKELVFHIPTAIFWGKMQRFLLGTYRNFKEQVEMAKRFNSDNKKYKEYVYMMIETVDKIDSMEKIDFFSNLVRNFLLEIIDSDLFYKLRQILLTCTQSELLFVKNNDPNKRFEYNMMIFSLKSIGLTEQVNTENDTFYKFTDLARVLKTYALCGDDVSKPAITYSELSAPEDWEPMKFKDIDNMFNDKSGENL